MILSKQDLIGSFYPLKAYVVWLSADVASTTELSCGLHSIEVMGFLWCLKLATKLSSLKERKSQIRNDPSSHPDATMQLASLARRRTGSKKKGRYLFELATNLSSLNDRRSQIRNDPLSHPDATMQLASLASRRMGTEQMEFVFLRHLSIN